jgi:hypothetical protein
VLQATEPIVEPQRVAAEEDALFRLSVEQRFKENAGQYYDPKNEGMAPEP